MNGKYAQILWTIFIPLLIGCSTSSQNSWNQHMKEAYISDVKQVYFRDCLKHGFDNEEIRKLNRIDRSIMTDGVLGVSLYEKLDSLSKLTAQRMIQDSINSVGRVAEGAEGKSVYGSCLREYNSAWLDSLARKEWKKSRKMLSK